MPIKQSHKAPKWNEQQENDWQRNPHFFPILLIFIKIFSSVEKLSTSNETSLAAGFNFYSAIF
jgi:hypothetical protein